MRRARILVSAACGILALSLATLVWVGWPDEGERILSRYGPLSRHYFENADPSRPDSITFETEVAGSDAEKCGPYEGYVRSGWRRGPEEGVVFHTKDVALGVVTIAAPEDGKIWVVYGRTASPTERMVHRIKRALGIDDLGELD